MKKLAIKPSSKEMFSPGHSACAGCGLAIAARLVAEAAGKDTIITNATGCLEVTTSQYPRTSWGMPWIHSVFENAAGVASGVYAALKQKKLASRVKVIAQGGDGGTYDIGFGLVSGMWERGEDILYVCYDNEAYMNTGVQASGATPYDAATTTTPAGKKSFGSTFQKKDLPQIAVAHGLKYVATATVGYPLDIQRKVKKALSVPGPTYLQILTPCVPGWGIASDQAVNLGKLAQKSGIWPVVEIEDGKVTAVMPYDEKVDVVDYLKPQKRFKHLFTAPGGEKEIEKIRKIAQKNKEKYPAIS